MVWHTGLELFTPVSINAEPIQHLLDEYARQNYEPIDKWIHSKTQELQYVGVLGALMASLLCSAFTWPLADDTIWVVTALWYSGLVFVLASVATATQQSITLSRFASLPDHESRIKDMLGYEHKDSSGTERRLPRYGVVFIGQIPVMMLRFGVYFFMVGLGVLLGYAAWKAGNVFSSEAKTVTMFAVVTVFAISCHAASVFWSYSRWVALQPQDRRFMIRTCI